MFEIETFTDLVYKSLPLRLQLPELRSLMAAFAKARRPQLTAEARAWRHDYMTWRSIKHFLEHNLHDQNLKDILRTYVPRDGESKFDGSLGLSKAPVTFLGKFVYRPGQPNWEYTMWKFQDFSASQILCEINFGHLANVIDFEV